MREWYVYELRAGEWFHIGQSSNLRMRHNNHRCQIRKARKPDPWKRALEQYPDPDDWTMKILDGPYHTREQAIKAEMHFHKKYENDPGRVWDSCGYNRSQSTKHKMSLTHQTQDCRALKSESMKASWARRKAQQALEHSDG